MAVLPFHLAMTLGLPLVGLVLLLAAGGLGARALFRRRGGQAGGARYPVKLALIGAGLVAFPTAYFFYVLGIP